MTIRAADRDQRFSVNVELHDPALVTAVLHPEGDLLLGCAVRAVLAALAAGARWPQDLTVTLSGFMYRMRETVQSGDVR